MFSHHIITCLLIIGSLLLLFPYWSFNIDDYGFSRHFLAAAKMLKYAGFSNACDAMFFIFSQLDC